MLPRPPARPIPLEPPEDPGDEAWIQTGASRSSRNCAVCHGIADPRCRMDQRVPVDAIEMPGDEHFSDCKTGTQIRSKISSIHEEHRLDHFSGLGIGKRLIDIRKVIAANQLIVWEPASLIELDDLR